MEPNQNQPHDQSRGVVAAARRVARNVVERVRRNAKAARILGDWLGRGGEPVPKSVAEDRAEVCYICPKNGPSPYTLEPLVAEAILEQERQRHSLKLTTEHDSEINTCQVCYCYLKLKVWVPAEHLLKENDPMEFPDHCWMRRL